VLASLTTFIEQHDRWALVVLFVLLALVSFGLPVPGETALIACAVIALRPGGQLGFCTIASTCRETRKKNAASRIPATARIGRHRRFSHPLIAVELTVGGGSQPASDIGFRASGTVQ